jgi:hypothetical protein
MPACAEAHVRIGPVPDKTQELHGHFSPGLTRTASLADGQFDPGAKSPRVLVAREFRRRVNRSAF